MHCEHKFVQPEPQDWKFVSELSLSERRIFNWSRKTAKTGEVDISGGINIIQNFHDKNGILQTAYDDLKKFFSESGIPFEGKYAIVTETGSQTSCDSFELMVESGFCRIIAGNAEGIRRGIYYLEDLLLGADGPFLRLGVEKRSSWLRNRISRCFFGPIKRPPLNHDELLNDVDYYPEEYLNRLAHEGINGLWLTITFKDLCKTSFIPENGVDAARRLDKLRRTADKCLRYGIKTYIFCIEPAAWRADDPVLIRHPELGGAKSGNAVFFCPFSESSQKYLYESVYSIFKAVPNLGGMINISYGECDTTCLSSVWPTEARSVDCPVCSGKKHWEILHSALSAMGKGMQDAAPEARLISWLYMPQSDKVAEWIYEIPKHTPDNIILQFNFESGGSKDQLGKMRSAGDYWLSYVGPSDRFKTLTENAFSAKTEMSVKIQVGCSLEVATVPIIPVPGQLYQKYKKMHELGVSSVMQCWYWGNYPGLMNKAAGNLAFEDFAGTEKDFLLRLALPDWGSSASEVVKAWELFAKGYSNYPLSLMFQYYGPINDGIVWPLYLYPANQPLVQTWSLELGTSGDVIGECLDNHCIEDAIELCRRMSDKWTAGIEIMKKLRRRFQNNPARLKDIGLAEALGIQFESGYNILRFYALREDLLEASGKLKNGILDQMESIVSDEIKRSTRMIELCECDSRLGFHPETEGYKYFPQKLKWRIGMLQSLLSEDFPKARAGQLHVQSDRSVPVYNCGSGVKEDCGAFTWNASNDDKFLTIETECQDKGNPDQFFITVVFKNTFISIIDLFKSGRVSFSRPGGSHHISETLKGWKAKVRIPMAEGVKTARFSIIRVKDDQQVTAWGGKPLKYRLLLGMYNPEETGLLIFK